MILGLDGATYLVIVISVACLFIILGMYLVHRSCSIPHEGMHVRRDHHAGQPTSKHHTRTSPRIREAQREAWEAQRRADRQRRQDTGWPIEDGQESRAIEAPVALRAIEARPWVERHSTGIDVEWRTGNRGARTLDAL